MSMGVKVALVAIVIGLGAYFALGRSSSEHKAVEATVDAGMTVSRGKGPPPRLVRPPIDVDLARRVFADAKRRGDKNPGAAAFRSYTDQFVAANEDAVERQMTDEGLSRREIEELTYFSLLAQRTVDWPDVEKLLGRDVPPEKRELAQANLREQSSEMKRRLREHVKRGDTASVRVGTIKLVQKRYLKEYYLITGMTPALLDELLRGSVLDELMADEPIPGSGDKKEDSDEFDVKPGWRGIKLSDDQASALERMKGKSKKSGPSTLNSPAR